MPIKNLRTRYCPLCKPNPKRGDIIGASNLIEIKSEKFANAISSFFGTTVKKYDIICRKHEKEFLRKSNPKIYNIENNDDELSSATNIELNEIDSNNAILFDSNSCSDVNVLSDNVDVSCIVED